MSADVSAAVAALRLGKPVVIPTDTVYGVAALPAVAAAIEQVFWAKGRPKEKALPVLAASIGDLRSVVVFDDRAEAIGKRFWPGALTLVLPRDPGFTYDLGSAATETVAVRVPEHPLTQELLGQTGPLAVTSANRSGDTPARTVEDAREALGEVIEVYLDGGECYAEPSTIVSLVDGFDVLRVGDIDPDAIRSLL